MRLLAGMLAAVVVGSTVTGCAVVADPGPATTEQRQVTGVRSVRVETSGDLTLTVGNPTS